jgi:cbb3-type cytochrome oxidase maturation protein
MSVLAIILPLALLLVAAAVAAWVWAARSGQFDDTDTPASRLLSDDVPSLSPRSGAAPSGQAAMRRAGGVVDDSTK